MSSFQIKTSCIKNVPFHTYDKDFSFLINGKEFKTSRLISEILSPIICKMHIQDPTIDKFTINTRSQGDFSLILKLVEFEKIQITNDEIDFFIEVIEKLGNDKIIMGENCQSKEYEITKENVIDNIKKHEKNKIFYSDRFDREIKFISSHFFELCEEEKDEIQNLQLDTLLSILSNHELVLKSEDQLIEFINELYLNDQTYSILYETVNFINVSSENITTFVKIFDYNDMNSEIWTKISKRLQEKVELIKDKSDRYKEVGIKFIPNNENSFTGIINYLRTQSKNKIENEINITASSICNSGENYQPKTVVMYENKNNWFHSRDTPNSWLCIDFKEHQVIPTDYTIRSSPYETNNFHLKSWKIEGSVDKNKWDTIDEITNCSFLNGNNNVHTFHINEQKTKFNKYRYIKIQETSPNWRNDNYLVLNAFEIYGTLI